MLSLKRTYPNSDLITNWQMNNHYVDMLPANQDVVTVEALVSDHLGNSKKCRNQSLSLTTENELS